METAEKAIRAFMSGEKIEVSIQEMDQPDVLLWAVWCIQQYGKLVSMDTCVGKYNALVRDIMTWILGNNHPNLKVMDNKLLHSEGRDKAITWMNSTANGRPIVPRTGYIVEFNALWYNAIKFCVDLCAHTGDAQNVKVFSELAEQVGKSFVDMFWNEHGYLCDYCVDGYRDYLVRPNMIFAVAFDYTPLDKKQQKSVLDYCTKELLTPKGLRSLSPKSSGYNPMYVGPQVQRDYAYHQGTAWPWLAGFYMEACLKVHKMSRASFVDRLLVGYEEELFYHCIGTIPELFDGNPPFHGRGAISFAMNVAEIMRVVKLLDQYNEY
jgi:predicted glycogen debranching enzyme